MTDTIQPPVEFPAGADVPSWLVAVDPMMPGASFQSLVFVVPVQVFEASDDYLVVPQRHPGEHDVQAIMHLSAHGCRLYAPAKRVRLLSPLMDVLTLDTSILRPIPCAPAPQPAQPAPGLLRRLWRWLF